MAYDEKLAQRVRESLPRRGVGEKRMMGGLTFMVNGKMCVGIVKDELMVRVDPELYESALEKPGAKPMDFTGRPMRGFLFVEPLGMKDDASLTYWLELALEFNKRAKSSKKRR